MKIDFQRIFSTSKKFLNDNSPIILTGIGIASFIGSTILAVKATPKATKIIEEIKENKEEEVKTIDIVKNTYKLYIPSIILGCTGTACIIGATSINNKRNTALASLYAVTEQTLINYKNEIKEKLSSKDLAEVNKNVAQKNADMSNEVEKNRASTIILDANDDTLFYDPLIDRCFKSNMGKIRAAINSINNELNNYSYVSLNNFYDELGISNVKLGDDIGWNVGDGLVEPCYEAIIYNDRPCISIDYNVMPRINYDKFM